MATSSVYTDEELLKRYKAADYIYGTMYGERIDEPNYIYRWVGREEREERDVKILNIRICSNNPTLVCKEGNYYLVWIWGGPGPDANIYYFSDYGRTWAFTKEELEANRYKKDVSSDG
jgi:hypothetical protein